jgi:hypothetical protein
MGENSQMAPCSSRGCLDLGSGRVRDELVFDSSHYSSWAGTKLAGHFIGGEVKNMFLADEIFIDKRL